MPLAQSGLDASLGLAGVTWRIGFGSGVVNPQVPQEAGEAAGQGGRTVIGHEPPDDDTEPSVVAQLGEER